MKKKSPRSDSSLVEIRLIGAPQQVETVAAQIEALFAGQVVSATTLPSRDPGRVRRYIHIGKSQ
jgi:hypothetical protein